MITKWLLSKYPSETDMDRHALFMDGDIKDLRLVMNKFSKLAESSHRAGSPYTYAVFLAHVTPAMRDAVRSAMPGICRLAEQTNPSSRPVPKHDMDFFNKLTQSLLNLQNEKTNPAGGLPQPESAAQSAPPPELAQNADFGTADAPAPYMPDGDGSAFFRGLEDQLLQLDKNRAEQEVAVPGQSAPQPAQNTGATPFPAPQPELPPETPAQDAPMFQDLRIQQEPVAPQPAPEAAPAGYEAAQPLPAFMPQATPAAQPEPFPATPAPQPDETAPSPFQQTSPQTDTFPHPGDTVTPPETQTQPAMPEPIIQAVAPQEPDAAAMQPIAQQPVQEAPLPAPQPAQPAQPPSAPPTPPRTPPPAATEGRTQPPLEEIPSVPSSPADTPPSMRPARHAATLQHIRRANFQWDICAPLNPLWTMDTVLTGSHNRAVHAKASAITDNPGSFFNPYFISGAPGSGKTHLLNAVYYGMEKSLGPGTVMYTTGMRLSKGIRRAVDQGTWQELDAQLSALSAIVVDDINLMVMTSSNRDLLAQTLGSFPGNRKQMVASSVFGRRALGDFEAMWNTHLPSGYEGSIACPDPQTAKDTLLRMLDKSDLSFPNIQDNVLFSGESPLETGQVNMSRLHKLKGAMGSEFPNEPQRMTELLALPLGAQLEIPTAEEIEQAEKFSPPNSNEWGRWGVYYPEGEENLARYTLMRLYERAQELGIDGWFETAFMKSYSNPNAYTTPIEMADTCDNSKLRGALLVGPMPSTDFIKLEKDFFHTFTRAFEGLGMQCATLATQKTKHPQSYTAILTDLALF
ncbi:MAG: DnaA/Hda family protein [Elusimicrobiales bacterium]